MPPYSATKAASLRALLSADCVCATRRLVAKEACCRRGKERLASNAVVGVGAKHNPSAPHFVTGPSERQARPLTHQEIRVKLVRMQQSRPLIQSVRHADGENVVVSPPEGGRRPVVRQGIPPRGGPQPIPGRRRPAGEQERNHDRQKAADDAGSCRPCSAGRHHGHTCLWLGGSGEFRSGKKRTKNRVQVEARGRKWKTQYQQDEDYAATQVVDRSRIIARRWKRWVRILMHHTVNQRAGPDIYLNISALALWSCRPCGAEQ